MIVACYHTVNKIHVSFKRNLWSWQVRQSLDLDCLKPIMNSLHQFYLSSCMLGFEEFRKYKVIRQFMCVPSNWKAGKTYLWVKRQKNFFRLAWRTHGIYFLAIPKALKEERIKSRKKTHFLGHDSKVKPCDGGSI